jgi:hypothetical protein
MTTREQRRILLLGAVTPAATMVAEQLRRANCEVVSCCDPNGAAFPCTGLRTGACPLDQRRPDAAVLVRTRLHPRPRPSEIGVVCALRDRVPLVLTGSVVLNPFEPWATTTCDLGDVVATVDAICAREGVTARS